MSDIIYTKPQPEYRRFDGPTELQALAALRAYCARRKLLMLTPNEYTVTYKSSGVWIDVPDNLEKK